MTQVRGSDNLSQVLRGMPTDSTPLTTSLLQAEVRTLQMPLASGRGGQLPSELFASNPYPVNAQNSAFYAGNWQQNARLGAQPYFPANPYAYAGMGSFNNQLSPNYSMDSRAPLYNRQFDVNNQLFGDRPFTGAGGCRNCQHPRGYNNFSGAEGQVQGLGYGRGFGSQNSPFSFWQNYFNGGAASEDNRANPDGKRHRADHLHHGRRHMPDKNTDLDTTKTSEDKSPVELNSKVRNLLAKYDIDPMEAQTVKKGSMADEALREINRFRKEHGKKPWRLDEKNQIAATLHAAYQAKHGLGHTEAIRGFSTPNERNAQLGLPPGWENAGAGNITSGLQLAKMWENSAPHRAALLNDHITTVGIGVVGEGTGRVGANLTMTA